MFIISLLALFACATGFAEPLLSRAEAIRIAEAKAKSSGYDLRSYVCGPVNYEAREKEWWVNYRRKNAKYTEFSIQVEEKTKKAWVVVE